MTIDDIVNMAADEFIERGLVAEMCLCHPSFTANGFIGDVEVITHRQVPIDYICVSTREKIEAILADLEASAT